MYSYNLGLRFEHIAATYPENDAIVIPEVDSISYASLNAKANRVARYMQDRGICSGDVVCLSGDKRSVTFAAMIAALKIGAIYCILDPESPLERICKILTTCMPKMVIGEQRLLEDLQTFDLSSEMILVPSNAPALDEMIDVLSPENLPTTSKVTGAQPAYIMFTSGSTGVPKGAVISHDGVLNLIDWSQKAYGNGPDEILTNVNPLYFDNSVFDFYSALFTGATLVPFSKQQVTNPRLLLDLIDKAGCTQWFSVPSMLIYLQTMKALTPDRLQSIKRVIFGGEGYPKATLKKLHDLYGDRIDFHNVYGPTECTCICSTYLISEADFEDLNGFPPLGTLIENFDYIILDEDDNPAPADTYGELCLMGPNVGYGYYNRPEITQRSFIQNPVNTQYPETSYKTGDLVKFCSADGKLHIRGRVDNQIKHMGYRIELEEIETALNQIDYISQAAVVHGQFRGLSKMVAAVCATSDIEDKKIREDLKQIIPSYMIPSTFHTVEELPKNANGKVDRKKIAEMYFG